MLPFTGEVDPPVNCYDRCCWFVRPGLRVLSSFDNVVAPYSNVTMLHVLKVRFVSSGMLKHLMCSHDVHDTACQIEDMREARAGA